MAAETEISTPEEIVTDDTSAIVEPAENADTSAAEPEVTDETAETETGAEGEKDNKGVNEGKVTDNNSGEILYAGKYKNVEELEKGYIELQKLQSKPNEFEQKYNDLLKAQQQAEEKAYQEKLRVANECGFKTVEEQEAAEKIQVSELEWYANNLNLVSQEEYEQARAYLAEYLRTGHKDYLNTAKRFFPINFVECVTNAKAELNANLQAKIAKKRLIEKDEREKNLAQVIKTDFAEFLSDSSTNTAKANALKAMCDAGVINSKEDMQSFVNLYTSIVDSAKEAAIKEYEAQKAIEAEKQKAVIETGAITESLHGFHLPPYEQLAKLSQDEYCALVDKCGGYDKLLSYYNNK